MYACHLSAGSSSGLSVGILLSRRRAGERRGLQGEGGEVEGQPAADSACSAHSTIHPLTRTAAHLYVTSVLTMKDPDSILRAWVGA